MIVQLSQTPKDAAVDTAGDPIARSEKVLIWPSVVSGVAVYVITRFLDRLLFGGRG